MLFTYEPGLNDPCRRKTAAREGAAVFFMGFLWVFCGQFSHGLLNLQNTMTLKEIPSNGYHRIYWIR